MVELKPKRGRELFCTVLVAMTAVLTLIPNVREAMKVTSLSIRYWGEWKRSGAAWNYGDPWMSNLRSLLDENVQPRDQVMMMGCPTPCSITYAGYIYAAYMLCPKPLHYVGCGQSLGNIDWLYYPYAQDAGSEQWLDSSGLSGKYQVMATKPYQTLYGRRK